MRAFACILLLQVVSLGQAAPEGAWPLRAHVLSIAPSEIGSYPQLRGEAVFELSEIPPEDARSRNSRVRFNLVAGRSPHRFRLYFDPNPERTWGGIQIRLFNSTQGYTRITELPAFYTTSNSARLGAGRGRSPLIIWLPAPDQRTAEPTLHEPRVYADLLTASLLRPKDGDPTSNRLLRSGGRRLTHAAARLLTRAPLLDLLSAERIAELKSALPPKPSALSFLVDASNLNSHLPFGASPGDEGVYRAATIEAAYLLLGDLTILERWTKRFERLHENERSEGSEITSFRMRALGLFAQMTDDPELRGKALWPLLDPRGAYRQRQLYTSTFEQIDAGTVIIPGSPEQRAEREAMLERLALEGNLRQPIIILAVGIGLFAALTFLARKIASRLLFA